MATEPLAIVEDLELRLEFPLDDSHMRKMAGAALEDASTLVREYGVSSWDANTAPPIAVMLTLKAAARFMNNPMNLETARGADETNMWGESNSKGVYLEPSEIELLKEHKKADRGFYSAPVQLWGQAPAQPSIGHQAPVYSYGSGYAKYFPLYEPGDVYMPYYPPYEG